MDSGPPKNFYVIPIIMGSLFGVVFLTTIGTFIFCAIRNHKRNKRNMGIQSSPVVVTSSTYTPPGGNPVEQVPQTNYQANTLYTSRYPGRLDVTVDMSMMNQTNQNQGPAPHSVPTIQVAPCTSVGPSEGRVNSNPPSYDMVVAQEDSANKYEKQYELT